jgi:hypothetical protein
MGQCEHLKRQGRAFDALRQDRSEDIKSWTGSSSFRSLYKVSHRPCMLSQASSRYQDIDHVHHRHLQSGAAKWHKPLQVLTYFTPVPELRRHLVYNTLELMATLWSCRPLPILAAGQRAFGGALTTQTATHTASCCW